MFFDEFAKSKNMKFEKKIRMQVWFGVGFITLGLGMFILILISQIKGNTLPDYANAFYSGGGVGITLAGILTIVRCFSVLKSPTVLKEREIKFNDERLSFIRNKTVTVASTVILFALAVAVAVSLLFSVVVYWTLLAVLAFCALVCLITYIIVRAKY